MANPGMLRVIIRVNSTKISTCAGPAGVGCNISYSQIATPFIRDIYPQDLIPGGDLFVELLARSDLLGAISEYRLISTILTPARAYSLNCSNSSFKPSATEFVWLSCRVNPNVPPGHFNIAATKLNSFFHQ